MKAIKLSALFIFCCFIVSCECGEKDFSGTLPPYTDEHEESIGNLDKESCELDKIRIVFDRRVDRFTLIAPNGCEFKYPSEWGAVTHRGNVFGFSAYNTYTADNVGHTSTGSTGPRFTYRNCPLSEGEHYGVWKLKIEGSSTLSNDYTISFSY